MVATFSGCAMITHWLPHTPLQILFRLFLELKKVWYYLSTLSIQIGVFNEIFYINLLFENYMR